MIVYIALLRGINVSGQKKIRMADLGEMFRRLDFDDVSTYIQSGNVIFRSTENNTSGLEQKISKGIRDTFGFDVQVLVKTRSDIEKILKENPYTKKEDLEAKRIYFTLLKGEPAAGLYNNLNQEDYPNERFQITQNCVYLNCMKGAGNAKLTNNIIERKLKVAATTRNHRTLVKLLEISA